VETGQHPQARSGDLGIHCHEDAHVSPVEVFDNYQDHNGTTLQQMGPSGGSLAFCFVVTNPEIRPTGGDRGRVKAQVSWAKISDDGADLAST
jgi:hypothetical protein